MQALSGFELHIALLQFSIMHNTGHRMLPALIVVSIVMQKQTLLLDVNLWLCAL